MHHVLGRRIHKKLLAFVTKREIDFLMESHEIQFVLQLELIFLMIGAWVLRDTVPYGTLTGRLRGRQG